MTVEALQGNGLASESELFIFADAAKNAGAVGSVRKVKEYIGGIGGFKTVTIIEHVQNQGLARALIEGITRLSSDHGRVIVLEDDVVTSPGFLEYMNSALDQYGGEDRVMQVAGHMFSVDIELEEDALFLPFISSWGWATWERAWRHFDPLAGGYDRLLADSALRRKFDLDGHYKYFRMLQAQQRGNSESWAIRWYLSVFLRNGLALYPKKTLAKNIGFDGSGVNCNVSEFDQRDIDRTFRVTRRPKKIEISAKAGVVFNSMPVVRPSLRSIRNRVLRALIRR